MPPRSPCSLIHFTSSMASSMSLRKIWPMPARRSGYSAHQSASQRLWARTPARRCSYWSSFGGRGNSTKLGENGGTVLGNTTSATMPSDSCSFHRRSLSQLRTRRSVFFRSWYGFLYLPRQASKSSRYAGSRYSRYSAWLPPAWVSAEMIVYRSVDMDKTLVANRESTPTRMRSRAPMQVKELGHVVLFVRDLDRSRQFYRDVLGWHELEG